MLQLNLQEWSPSRWRGDDLRVDPPHLGPSSHTTPYFRNREMIWEKGDIGKKRGRLVGECPEIKILIGFVFV